MNEEQFERERKYQASAAVAKAMLENGILTAEEYRQIDTILLEKYRPILGSLCADNLQIMT
jgi:hypothetical protein